MTSAGRLPSQAMLRRQPLLLLAGMVALGLALEVVVGPDVLWASKLPLVVLLGWGLTRR